MSQPCDRKANVKAPGEIDESLKEFWVENPWNIVEKGFNLSAYERNRTWINVGGGNFLDISFLTGTDSDGDGRSVVAADFSNNGRQDLIVRQVGGGPLLFFENHFPQRHYLKVSLRGAKSNRQGIGARLIAEAAGQPRVRELYPINTFRSEMPNLVHFGLGDSDKVDRLTIRWPSGKVQVLSDLKADQHIVIDEAKEGAEAVETVAPGRTIAP